MNICHLECVSKINYRCHASPTLIHCIWHTICSEWQSLQSGTQTIIAAPPTYTCIVHKLCMDKAQLLSTWKFNHYPAKVFAIIHTFHMGERKFGKCGIDYLAVSAWSPLISR